MSGVVFCFKRRRIFETPSQVVGFQVGNVEVRRKGWIDGVSSSPGSSAFWASEKGRGWTGRLVPSSSSGSWVKRRLRSGSDLSYPPSTQLQPSLRSLAFKFLLHPAPAHISEFPSHWKVPSALDPVTVFPEYVPQCLAPGCLCCSFPPLHLTPRCLRGHLQGRLLRASLPSHPNNPRSASGVPSLNGSSQLHNCSAPQLVRLCVSSMEWL